MNQSDFALACDLWDRNNFKAALKLFTRAIDAGEIESALELAEIELARGNRASARRYLKRVAASDSVTESGAETARMLLAELGRSRD